MVARRVAPLLILLSLMVTLISAMPASAKLWGFSASDEERLGLQYHQELSKEYKVTDDERITRLGNRIASAAGMDGRVQFHLIDMGREDEPNAFQTPGHIYVTKSIAKLLSDDELTYVVGHEMGHQVKHHIRRAIERAQKTQFWTLLFSMVVPVPSEVLGLGTTGISNKFSRKQELEADRFGYLVTKQLGINVETAVEAFKKIMTEKAPPKMMQEIFGTHPLLNQRTARLEEAAKVEEKPPVVMAYPTGVAVIPPSVLAKMDQNALTAALGAFGTAKPTSIDGSQYYLRIEMLEEDYSENLIKNLATAWKTPTIWYVRKVDGKGNAAKVEFNVFKPDQGRAVIKREERGSVDTPQTLAALATSAIGNELTTGDISHYSFKGIRAY